MDTVIIKTAGFSRQIWDTFENQIVPHIQPSFNVKTIGEDADMIEITLFDRKHNRMSDVLPVWKSDILDIQKGGDPEQVADKIMGGAMWLDIGTDRPFVLADKNDAQSFLTWVADLNISNPAGFINQEQLKNLYNVFVTKDWVNERLLDRIINDITENLDSMINMFQEIMDKYYALDERTRDEVFALWEEEYENKVGMDSVLDEAYSFSAAGGFTLYNALFVEGNPREKMIALDRFINFAHQRVDYGEQWVEGGRDFLDELSGVYQQADNINLVYPDMPGNKQEQNEDGSNMKQKLKRKKYRTYNEPDNYAEQMNEGLQEQRNEFRGPGTENSYGGPYGAGRPAGW